MTIPRSFNGSPFPPHLVNEADFEKALKRDLSQQFREFSRSPVRGKEVRSCALVCTEPQAPLVKEIFTRAITPIKEKSESAGVICSASIKSSKVELDSKELVELEVSFEGNAQEFGGVLSTMVERYELTLEPVALEMFRSAFELKSLDDWEIAFFCKNPLPGPIASFRAWMDRVMSTYN